MMSIVVHMYWRNNDECISAHALYIYIDIVVVVLVALHV